MKIGIFTTFYNFDTAYSLTSVVRDQLVGLLRRNHEVVLFVLPSFKDDTLVPEGVEIRKVVPQIILEPYKEMAYPDTWKDDVKKVQEMVEKNTQDIEFLICHDIFFIDTYLPYNIGLREATPKLKRLQRIFAWTHSAPSSRPVIEDNPHANRYNLPPKTTLVYLNHDQHLALAEMYGAWLKDVRVVHNSRDPYTFWNLHPLTKKIIEKFHILSCDIISTYPVSTPRMTSGKRVQKIIEIHAHLKELGYKTRLIIPNAHANAEKDKQQVMQVLSKAYDLGLENQDVIFTSFMDIPKYEGGVPSEVVSDLFRISNVFIFPTISENCSLVLLEAMLAGNLIVLNNRVPSLREFGGEHALYFDFDVESMESKGREYYKDIAKIIASEFENNRSLKVRQRVMQQHNINKIAKDIEILFHEYKG